LDAINTHHILLAMRAAQGQELDTRDEPVRVEVLGEFARIQAAEEAAASRVTMLALVNRAQARLALSAPAVGATGTPSAALSLPAETLPAAIQTEQRPVEADAANGPAPMELNPKVKFPSVVHRPTPAETKSNPSTPLASAAPATPVAASGLNENESFPL